MALALSALVLGACSKGTEEAQCTKCGLMPVDKIVSIKVGGLEKTANVWNGRENTKYSLADIQSSTSAADMDATLRAVNLHSGIEKNSLIGVVYSVSENLADKPNCEIQPSDINAVTIYYDKGKVMGVKVFINNSGTLQEISELAGETGAISSNHSAILAEFFFEKGAGNVSSIIYSDNNKLGNKSGTDNFFYKLNKYVYGRTASKPTAPEFPQPPMHHTEHQGPNTRCGVPCLSGGSLTCDKRPSWSCKGLTDCPKLELQPWNSYAASADPRDPILYQFRDNILDKSELGQHFIYDFYYIGAVLKAKLNASIAAESFNVIDGTVLPVVNKLLNSPESTDICVNETQKNTLLAYVADVRQLSDDPVFLEILDEVEANIKITSQMTVKQVYDQVTTP